MKLSLKTAVLRGHHLWPFITLDLSEVNPCGVPWTPATAVSVFQPTWETQQARARSLRQRVRTGPTSSGSFPNVTPAPPRAPFLGVQGATAMGLAGWTFRPCRPRARQPLKTSTGPACTPAWAQCLLRWPPAEDVAPVTPGRARWRGLGPAPYALAENRRLESRLPHRAFHRQPVASHLHPSFSWMDSRGFSTGSHVIF